MHGRLQEQGAAKDAEWASIMGMPLFAQASDEGSASLGHLTALYVERHHSLWKVSALQFILRHCPVCASAGTAPSASLYLLGCSLSSMQFFCPRCKL